MAATIADPVRPPERSPRAPPLAWWLGTPLGLLGACWLAGLRLNLTGSLPIGLYLVSRAAPVRGALVLACLPPPVAAFAHARGYVPRGGSCPGGIVPVGKLVVAIAGDSVTVTLAGLLVNEQPVPNSQPLMADRKGRPLPRLALGRYAVRPGEVWVVSPYSPLSFDSRYFGAVEVAQVRARVRRLWTVGSVTGAPRGASRFSRVEAADATPMHYGGSGIPR